MGKANALYELQSLDLEIGAKKARLSDVNAALGDERPVQKAQAQLARIDADLRPLQTRHTNLELEIKTLETKVRTAEDRLYSGAVTNPKELQDMQSEVASLKRRRAALEDQLLEVMIQVEEQTAARKKAAARLEKTKQRWAADQTSLQTEQQTLEAELASCAAARATVWGALDAESQAAYDALWARTQGHPVAVLNADGACSRCGVTQNSAAAQRVRRGDVLVKCSGCGRILVAAGS